ncbi:MAG: DUF3857 domain-containing protein [Lewinellaceae bacterium]|nr:DUF3857 domain-containing protein [Lewinellaceae bacterium]
MPNPALLTTLFILGHLLLSAQDAPMKYGKVPKEDLEMKVYAPDTTASAIVLCDYGKVTYEFRDQKVRLNLEKHKRIKILKRAGFDEGNVVIYYYKNTDIKNLKAQVITPDGQEIEVAKKDFFDEKISENASGIRFAFPNLTEGCVVEYKYDYLVPYIFEIPEWYFQENIPVRWSELRLEIPLFYRYVSVHQGFTLDISESNVRERPFIHDRGSAGTTRGTTEYNIIRMVAKDMPGLKKESFITTMDDYYTRIRFQLASIQYPDEALEPIMSTWEKVAAKLLEDEDFGGLLYHKNNYDDLWAAAQIHLLLATDRDAKIHALYKFINSSFEREDGSWIYARKNFDELYEKKSARNSEMNLMLVALLKEAGIEAHPVLISTRDHGRPIPEYPVLDQFNHVIAMVNTEGKPPLLLDAGNSFRPPGLIAGNSLNGSGWVVRQTNPQWITFETTQSGETYFGTFQLDAGGNLNGAVQVAAEGYSAASRREDYSSKTPKEYWESEFQGRHPDVQVDSVTVEAIDDPDRQLKERFRCSLPGYAQVSGDFIYLTPMFYSSYFENPFKTEKRDYPVDIPYPFKERVILQLIIPPGYKVESLPEPARLALPDDGGRFQYVVTQNENKLSLNCTFMITNLHFEPGQYDVLRTFFGMAAEKFGEQIVLKRM